MPDTKRQWYKFTAAKAETNTATLHIYDVIGADPFFGGVDVNELVSVIEGLDPDTDLAVRINSPGGAAWDGLTLANAIMRHPGKTTTYVDGLAASAASLIALAGNEVVMSKYGQMMLHNARAGVHGTAEDLKSAADTLTKLNGSMAQFYADRTGGEPAEWARAMKRETWYTADEAQAAGLATSIDDSGKRDEVEAAAAASIAKASALFKYAGRQAAPAPSAQVTEDGPTGPEPKEGPVAISKQVAERLGLGEDATDDQILAKIEELETAKPDAPADPPAPATGEVADLAAAAAKLGLSVIDPGTLDEMRAKAELGAKAHEAMETNRISAAVDAAISLGKIPPSRRDHFVTLMRADEVGTTQLLGSIPAETAVPMTELGHSTAPEASAGELDWFDSAPTQPSNDNKE